jgi:hypothetical protein
MRETKFRFWDKNFTKHSRKDKRQMIYVDLKNADNLTVYNIEFLFLNFESMEYTGLKDKNGKEIYEGDIVTINDFNYKGEVKFGKGMQGEPADWEGPFWGWIFGKEEPLIDDFGDIEVIGNIYENKELLKEIK